MVRRHLARRARVVSLPERARLTRSHFRTEVKIVHDGAKLAVMARCEEPYGTVAQAQERDGPTDRDDSFQVYLATSGSSYVKYAVNSLGYAQDANGFSGGARISRPHVEWNSPVRVTARKGGRMDRPADVPLESVATVLGEAKTPHEWRILLMRYRPGRSGERRRPVSCRYAERDALLSGALPASRSGR